MTPSIQAAKIIQPIYTTDKRFIDIYGGRGSSKSWAVADMLIVKAMEKPRRILCTREIQNSIRDSVHKLLSDRIKKHDLIEMFIITEKSIRCRNGSEFIFKGLYRNENDIKSTEGIDYCWTEEAHSVSRKSLEALTPTIRNKGSQIIFTYNPTNEDDPIHEDYTLKERDDTLKIEINWQDNPWFPEVLRKEMAYDKRVDIDKYYHKWEGKCVKHTDAQVFNGKWEIIDFEAPENTMFNYGADWGFSQDPTSLIRNYIDDNNCLWIDYEVYGVGVDIDKTPAMFDKVPNSRKWTIVADSARPETISHMNNNGFKIIGATKGKGSVEDGVQKIRGFERIYIHPRCKHTIDEFRLYSYKIDKHTGLISNVLEDKHDHIIDALRYSLENHVEYATALRY